MTLSHSTMDFAGIPIDTYLTKDEQAYATLTSICKGLKVSNQNAIDWVRRHKKEAEGIPVVVGQFKKVATAYPVNLIGDFLDYRISLGDLKVLALYSATFRADLISDIKRAHLVSVSHAEQSELRAEIRLDLVNAMYALDPTKKKDWVTYMELQGESTEQERALLTSKRVYAQAIVRMKNYDKRKTHTDYETQINQWDISNLPIMREELATQGVSC